MLRQSHIANANTSQLGQPPHASHSPNATTTRLPPPHLVVKYPCRPLLYDLSHINPALPLNQKHSHNILTTDPNLGLFNKAGIYSHYKQTLHLGLLFSINTQLVPGYPPPRTIPHIPPIPPQPFYGFPPYPYNPYQPLYHPPPSIGTVPTSPNGSGFGVDYDLYLSPIHSQPA